MYTLRSFLAVDPISTSLWAAFSIFVLLVLAVAGLVMATRPRRAEHLLESSRKRAEQILGEAHEQSHALKVRAEADAVKIMRDRSADDEQLRLKQAAHITEMTAHAKALLEEQTEAIAQLYEDIAADLKKQALSVEQSLSEQSVTMSKSLMVADERMAGVFAGIGVKAQKDFEILAGDVRKRVSDELEKEVVLVRDAVAAYKKERFAVLDREIIGLVEDTARIVLNKSLSLEDHRGVILEALAEAKQQGVFGTLTAS
jgi:hypothetical protein